MLPRIQTHVPGLDGLLGGGFIRGSINLVLGGAGSGKTLLANQVVFAHVARDGHAVYITHYGETHARMLAFLRTTAFFDPTVVGKSLVYLSALGAVEREATAGLLDIIEHALRSSPGVLVVDELLTAELFAESATAFKRFLHTIAARAETTGTTVLLASTDDFGGMVHAQAVADSVIRLRTKRAGMRMLRELEITKLRGSAFIGGIHSFEADARGISVYPRLEAIAGNARPRAGQERERATCGTRELDAMTNGGWPRGSSTLVLGAAGSGKTIVALAFLAAGVKSGDPSMYFGFYEAPENVVVVAENAGIDLGGTHIQWRPRREHLVDRMAHELLAEVDRLGIKRLVVDGIHGFTGPAVHDKRMSEFFGALNVELRARGVTSFWTSETHQPQGPDIRVDDVADVSAISQNILLLRGVERAERIHRILMIKKLRSSPFDSASREFWITSEGLKVAPDAQSAAKLLGHGVVATNAGPRRTL